MKCKKEVLQSIIFFIYLSFFINNQVELEGTSNGQTTATITGTNSSSHHTNNHMVENYLLTYLDQMEQIRWKFEAFFPQQQHYPPPPPTTTVATQFAENTRAVASAAAAMSNAGNENENNNKGNNSSTKIKVESKL